MKKLLTLLVIFAAALFAAKPIVPTSFVVTCDGGTEGGNCSQPHFVAGPVDPTVFYEIDGTNGAGETVTLYPDQGGTIDLELGSFLDGLDWNFEIHALGAKGNVKGRVLESACLTL